MKNQEHPVISFGMLADLQYCDAEPEHNRFFRNAPAKLSQSFETLNKYELDFIVNLGDTIDHDWRSFESILPHFQKAKAPVFHVLGNHDYEIEDKYKSQVHQKLGIQKYYSWSIKHWRFIVLDGNEISTYANPEGSSNYNKAEEYLNLHNINSNFWNGGIGTEQMGWLQDILVEAEKSHEKVIIFCHFPLYPPHLHNLLNDEELLHLNGKFEGVKAWISGHNHRGNYGMIHNTHFVNMRGMVDTKEDLAFSRMNIYENCMEIKGFGVESSYKLII